MPYIIFIAICLPTLLLVGKKWELRTAHYVPWSVFVSILGCAAIALLEAASLNVHWLVPVFIALAQSCVLSATVILYFFFRDPERTTPVEPGLVVSPADGRVVYVKEIADGLFPLAVKGRNQIPLKEFSEVDLIAGKGVQIGIAMNFLNVHVNRSPIAGKIEMVRAIPGRFASLKHVASLLENERVLMVTRGEGVRLGIVQIASRLVRRIIPYVQEGDEVARGQRVGMIRFGSQVDVLIPEIAGLEVRVREGDEVTAGETSIAVWEP